MRKGAKGGLDCTRYFCKRGIACQASGPYIFFASALYPNANMPDSLRSLPFIVGLSDIRTNTFQRYRLEVLVRL